MKIHFCRSQGFTSWIIRTFTMSQWNHVAIEIDGVIFHATGSNGVHITTPEKLGRDYPVIEPVRATMPHQDLAFAFAVNQLGKRYDWGAVYGMFFRANWHNDSKWFCSELAAAVLEAGGQSLRLPGHRVTPRDLWVALPEATSTPKKPQPL